MTMAKLITWDMLRKMSIVFSNVPGPCVNPVYQGKKLRKIMFFVPGFGTLGAGISIISLADILKVGCISDESRIAEPKELMEIFNRNLDKILAGNVNKVD